MAIKIAGVISKTNWIFSTLALNRSQKKDAYNDLYFKT